jgi:hypothetical protein
MSTRRGPSVSELVQQVARLGDLERLAVHVRRRHQFIVFSCQLPDRSDDLRTIPMPLLR